MPGWVRNRDEKRERATSTGKVGDAGAIIRGDVHAPTCVPAPFRNRQICWLCHSPRPTRAPWPSSRRRGTPTTRTSARPGPTSPSCSHLERRPRSSWGRASPTAPRSTRRHWGRPRSHMCTPSGWATGSARAVSRAWCAQICNIRQDGRHACHCHRSRSGESRARPRRRSRARTSTRLTGVTRYQYVYRSVYITGVCLTLTGRYAYRGHAVYYGKTLEFQLSIAVGASLRRRFRGLVRYTADRWRRLCKMFHREWCHVENFLQILRTALIDQSKFYA